MLPQSKPADHASPRIGLVVDPDAGNRDQCRSILGPIVQDIVYAEDGREALALAITHRPRFVITATGLRFIDGYTLCSLLRAEPLTADVPIVMLTCDTTPATVTLARSSGADRVVRHAVLPGNAAAGRLARTRSRVDGWRQRSVDTVRFAGVASRARWLCRATRDASEAIHG